MEKSSSQPQRFILLDEGSPEPFKVDAAAYFNFDARVDQAMEKLLARWELRGCSPRISERRIKRRPK